MIKVNFLTLFLLHAVAMTAISQVQQFTKDKVYRIDAATAKTNSQSTEIIADERLSNNKGMVLKPGVSTAIDGGRTEADIVFNVKAPKAGRYVMSTFAVTNTEGAELMKKAKGKYESLFIKIQIDDRRPTKRVVYVPWDRPRQVSGKFDLDGSDQQLKIWLPRGVILDYVEFRGYVPPAVPVAAQSYHPKIVPPAGHPRLWVNQQSLPAIKARLKTGENMGAWKKVEETALAPYVFEFAPDAEMSYNADLERAIEAKAFYYLMTGDEKTGKEAIHLMTDYLSHVEFGNILDITREIGRAIYTASEVYDWCYALLDKKNKDILYKNMMRLADDMECGWPPFKQSIINGHGGEAQINRDLLSMSIAIYDEDPLPYQYTSYAILERLIPMRRFEYQSPRHNQGVDYGATRFGWEMYAAWLFYRMNSKPVFDDNIKDVSKFWQYMRIPDGQMLSDGDGYSRRSTTSYYWKRPQNLLLYYAYSADPLLKAEFERQGGLPGNPLLFLLLNDPGLKAEKSMESVPLTKDFGPVLGSMVARTGWHIGMNSSDVVAEIKGGGYHFGNHQHSDAGSIQLYYRGFQFGDIGEYKFYGTPYDMNFNKRSIAHSMMLAVHPGEKFLETESNDGGTRFIQRAPQSPEETQTDPQFNNGKVQSADFGPSKIRPSFSYFKVDLTKAYWSEKMSAYSRGFCFLNLDKDDIPAAIILTDDMTTTNPEFKKYWQINAYNMPEKTKSGVVLQNQRDGLIGKTYVDMLIPAASDRQMDILSGSDANSSFGHKYDPPLPELPEANGHRIMISPKKANNRDHFLTVFQMVDGKTKPLPVSYYETPVSYVVVLADRVVSMSNSSDLISKEFELNISGGKKYQVVLTGMEPGSWDIKNKDGKVNFTADVVSGKNTIFFQAGSGEYVVIPRK